MSRAWKITLVVSALLFFTVLWLWWSQPERVDMADYVPADALVFLEANSLPEIAEGIVATDAWRELAPAAGINPKAGQYGWLTRLAGWTGIGSHETVIIMRAQVAVCILGFNAAETPDATLKISPRGAVVVETHTGASRVRAAVEKAVGSFARRSLGASEFARREEGGAAFYTWAAPSDGRRRVVAAVLGSVAVVGNDEASVRACLSVRRGERPSLAGDPQLREMRARLGGEDTLAFGYAPPGSAAKVAEAAAPLFVGQASDEPRVQSLLASLLPKLAHRIVGAAAWSSQLDGGAFVDRYLVLLPDGLAHRLSSALPDSGNRPTGAVEMLPADAHQVSFYSYQNPEAAWLALNAGLSSQVDTLQAPLVTLALEAMLEPYGVETPLEFLRATQSEVVTARLDETSDSKVLIVGIRDKTELLSRVRKRLGEGALQKVFGGAEVWVSTEAERGAAAFLGEYLIMGQEEDVLRCISMRAEDRSLNGSVRFKSADEASGGNVPHVRTLTSDESSARSFVLSFARRRTDGSYDAEKLNQSLRRLPYSFSETKITEEGLEKRTRSAFGLFGSVVSRFAPADTSGGQ